VRGGRGSVMRWDAGTFNWEVDDPGRVVVSLHGQRLQGLAVLEKTQTEEWLLRILVEVSR
jgi:hypothetical protein